MANDKSVTGYINKSVLSVDPINVNQEWQSKTQKDSIIKQNTEKDILTTEETSKSTEQTSTQNDSTQINSGTYCNGKYWSTCADGLIFICPPSGGDASCTHPQTGKDYHSDLTTTLRRNIAINESFVDFLHDTDDELRDARDTLYDMPNGGVFGEARDVNIQIVDALLELVSSTLSFVGDRIAFLEGRLASLDANPTQFITKETFESYSTPEDVEEDITGARADLQSDLQEVHQGIQDLKDAL
jgi:hypothetical protein